MTTRCAKLSRTPMTLLCSRRKFPDSSHICVNSLKQTKLLHTPISSSDPFSCRLYLSFLLLQLYPLVYRTLWFPFFAVLLFAREDPGCTFKLKNSGRTRVRVTWKRIILMKEYKTDRSWIQWFETQRRHKIGYIGDGRCVAQKRQHTSTRRKATS